jgi:hypothetical protein
VNRSEENVFDRTLRTLFGDPNVMIEKLDRDDGSLSFIALDGANRTPVRICVDVQEIRE